MKLGFHVGPRKVLATHKPRGMPLVLEGSLAERWAIMSDDSEWTAGPSNTVCRATCAVTGGGSRWINLGYTT